jgi:hypothetical protein
MPVEETPAESGAPPRHQIIQDAANLAVLSRQAIASNFDTMAVDPKVCANVAKLVEELTSTQDEAPAPEDAVPASEMLDHAREEGRRQAVEAFAQEKADFLQRINDLEAAQGQAKAAEDSPGQQRLDLDPPQADASPEPIRGPGQH